MGQGARETLPKHLKQRKGHRATINGLEGYYREHVKAKSEGARNKRDPGLPCNRFKTTDLWKKVRLIWMLLYAIRIVF